MKPLYESLPLSAQTSYAQLLDAAQASEIARSVSSLPGSFARKRVKDNIYWYFQHTDVSGRLRQIYVGPDNERTRALVDAHDRHTASALVQPLVNAAIALGCEPVLLAHFRVIRRLADYGFFSAGGVLVGTHAFLAYGNMLGVRWGETSRTQDVDFAHAGKQMAIALPGNVQVDAHAAIESLAMGFLPVLAIAGRAGASYATPSDPDFQLDFLTPLHRGANEPYVHPDLRIMLQPAKFMEYLLEDVQQAALFSAEGVVTVNVPHPARYALHKLIVFAERSATRRVKANKDLRQTAALLSFYKSSSAWEVDAAWKNLVARGPGWRERALRGRDALDALAPELDAKKWLRAPNRATRRSRR
ncbi:MAG TPA: nucleotidyltransferase domain-containing protein [Rhodanobacteraceae bacterium]|nr:nucleotidyltransferase domain-containing protein [Rhodanobacteraceae bacterium]